ncbi:TPA: hypothetical protein MND73_000794 [Salmonella enterica subsp. houtenae]|nr:hypothetical protein [Salmonella enterica subsp. houtenae]
MRRVIIVLVLLMCFLGGGLMHYHLYKQLAEDLDYIPFAVEFPEQWGGTV